MDNFVDKLNKKQIKNIISWIEKYWRNLDIFLFLGSGFAKYVDNKNRNWQDMINKDYKNLKIWHFHDFTSLISKEYYNECIELNNNNLINYNENNDGLKKLWDSLDLLTMSIKYSLNNANKLSIITTNHCNTVSSYFKLSNTFNANKIKDFFSKNKSILYYHTLHDNNISSLDDYLNFIKGEFWNSIEIASEYSKQSTNKKLFIIFGSSFSELHINLLFREIKNQDQNCAIIWIRDYNDFISENNNNNNDFILENNNEDNIKKELNKLINHYCKEKYYIVLIKDKKYNSFFNDLNDELEYKKRIFLPFDIYKKSENINWNPLNFNERLSDIVNDCFSQDWEETFKNRIKIKDVSYLANAILYSPKKYFNEVIKFYFNNYKKFKKINMDINWFVVGFYFVQKHKNKYLNKLLFDFCMQNNLDNFDDKEQIIQWIYYSNINKKNFNFILKICFKYLDSIDIYQIQMLIDFNEDFFSDKKLSNNLKNKIIICIKKYLNKNKYEDIDKKLIIIFWLNKLLKLKMSFTCAMINFFDINNYDSFLLYCSTEVISHLYILEIFYRNLELDDKKLFIQQVEYKENNIKYNEICLSILRQIQNWPINLDVDMLNNKIKKFKNIFIKNEMNEYLNSNKDRSNFEKFKNTIEEIINLIKNNNKLNNMKSSFDIYKDQYFNSIYKWEYKSDFVKIFIEITKIDVSKENSEEYFEFLHKILNLFKINNLSIPIEFYKENNFAKIEKMINIFANNKQFIFIRSILFSLCKNQQLDPFFDFVPFHANYPLIKLIFIVKKINVDLKDIWNYDKNKKIIDLYNNLIDLDINDILSENYLFLKFVLHLDILKDKKKNELNYLFVKNYVNMNFISFINEYSEDDSGINVRWYLYFIDQCVEYKEPTKVLKDLFSDINVKFMNNNNLSNTHLCKWIIKIFSKLNEKNENINSAKDEFINFFSNDSNKYLLNYYFCDWKDNLEQFVRLEIEVSFKKYNLSDEIIEWFIKNINNNNDLQIYNKCIFLLLFYDLKNKQDYKNDLWYKYYDVLKEWNLNLIKEDIWKFEDEINKLISISKKN